MHYAMSEPRMPSWIHTFPQQTLQGDSAHRAQRYTWLTPNGAPGPWNTRRDHRSA